MCTQIHIHKCRHINKYAHTYNDMLKHTYIHDYWIRHFSRQVRFSSLFGNMSSFVWRDRTIAVSLFLKFQLWHTTQKALISSYPWNERKGTIINDISLGSETPRRFVGFTLRDECYNSSSWWGSPHNSIRRSCDPTSRNNPSEMGIKWDDRRFYFSMQIL